MKISREAFREIEAGTKAAMAEGRRKGEALRVKMMDMIKKSSEKAEAEARRRAEAEKIAAKVSETKAEEILCIAEAEARRKREAAAEAEGKEKEAEECKCMMCLEQMDTEGQALQRRIYLPMPSKNVCAHAFHLGCLYEAIIKAPRERIAPNDLYDCSCAVCKTPIPSENVEAIICIYGKYGGSF